MENSETKYVEKIVRAKVKLESFKKEHSSGCIPENDPESFAPCSCGASEHNSKIDSILKELSL